MDKCLFSDTCATTLLMEKNKIPTTLPRSTSPAIERGTRADLDFYADDMGEDANTEMQFERNKRNVDILIKQQELYQQYLGRGSKQAKNLHNITQLPNGQRVVPTAQNTGRQDVSQLHKIIQEEICSGMGVPRSLMIGDSLYKSDTEGVTDMFKYNILWWKRTLGSMCTDIYQKSTWTPKNSKSAKTCSPPRSNTKYVQFPVHPYIPMDQLDYLYSNGVIDWDVYSKHCLRNTSLPDHLRMKHPPSTQPSKEPSKNLQRKSTLRM